MGNMKSKSLNKKNNVLYLIIAGVAILVFALLFFNKNSVKQTTGENEPSSGLTITPANVVTGDADYFNKEKGVITSPEIKRLPDGNPFKYELKLPIGWTVERVFDSENPTNLVISKGEYKLDINSVWLGSDCMLSGKTKPGLYETVETEFGTVRVMKSRTNFNLEVEYTLFNACQINSNSNDPNIKQWETNTTIGLIQYRVPLQYDSGVVDEMNKIISTISIID